MCGCLQSFYYLRQWLQRDPNLLKSEQEDSLIVDVDWKMSLKLRHFVQKSQHTSNRCMFQLVNICRSKNNYQQKNTGGRKTLFTKIADSFSKSSSIVTSTSIFGVIDNARKNSEA